MVAGKEVLVESDQKDRYGRVLGKIRLDGEDVNLQMLWGRDGLMVSGIRGRAAPAGPGFL